MNLLDTHVVIIRYSFLVGLGFLIVSVVLLLLMVINRFRRNRRDRHRRRFTEKWRPILLNNLYEPDSGLSRISRRDMPSFLVLWCHIHEILRGDAKTRLNEVGRDLGVDRAALRLIRSRRNADRILGTMVLGNLGDDRAWDRIQSFSRNRNQILAIAALHALARIHPERGGRVLLDFLVQNETWPDHRVANILYDLGPQAYTEYLADLIVRVPPEKKARLLNLMRHADGTIAILLARKLIRESNHREVITACLTILGLFGDEREIPIVRAFMDNPSPPVRIRAAIAMGQLAGEPEQGILEDALEDGEWWVRYRAAQGIASLPRMTIEKLEAVRDRQRDRFAADIMDYVISEAWTRIQPVQ